MVIINSKAFLLVNRNGDLCFESLSLDVNSSDDNLADVIRLDRRVDETDCSLSYSSGTNLTTITLPYDIVSGDTMRIITKPTISSSSCDEIPINTASGNTITVVGDVTSSNMFIGVKIIASAKLTTVYDKMLNGSTYVTTPHKSIQLLKANIRYNETSAFDVKVACNYYPTQTYSFGAISSGRYDGYSDGDLALKTGVFTVHVGRPQQEYSLTIENDTPFASNINGIDYLIKTKD